MLFCPAAVRVSPLLQPAASGRLSRALQGLDILHLLPLDRYCLVRSVGLGTALYRAPAVTCNSCSLKLNCTDSDAGRLLERRLDTWIDSELRRFHRGMSFTLLLLATVLLAAEVVRHPEPPDRKALAFLLLLLGLVQFKLLPSLWSRRRLEHV